MIATRSGEGRELGLATGRPAPEISVVVPVFNEEGTLHELHAKVAAALAGESWELVLVDDGSSDRSAEILRGLAAAHPEVVAVELSRNFGQHPAVLAGFSVVRGRYVVTLDADLQNPPEEIPRLVAEMRRGHDYVGSVRAHRQDPWLRKGVSSLVNRVTTASLGVAMSDYGCMLRGYSREVAREIVELGEQSSFIPALATMLARRPVEIDVAHDEREVGRSKYSPLRLMRLGFDLVTGFSLLPIQLVSLSGVVIAILGVAFAIFLFVRRLFVGPESEGVFTLFAILFAFVGVLLLAVGLVGEYVGRIYAEVRRRPIFQIREVVRNGSPREDAAG
ncbi:MAG TPA: glycosyltransferase [Candidatus Binatia bacterium]|nr:glycosyltransferase [Candidatus Binatia bacterium]